eukprot:Opistho-1_new@106982
MAHGGVSLPDIAVANAGDRASFVAAITTLFEPAPPLADYLLSRRPFASYAAVIDAAEAFMHTASESERIEMLNAHPRIGKHKSKLSPLSLKEQGYGDSGPEQEAVLAELAQLNRAYEDAYGFKFIVFVAGRPKSAIVPVLRERLASGDRAAEMRTGLKAMVDIARDRLRKIEAESAPSSRM